MSGAHAADRDVSPRGAMGTIGRAGRTPDLPRLPARLRALLAELPDADAIADVGTGHGALAAHLSARGVTTVIATEINPAPLADTRRNLRRWGLDGSVTTRLGSGLAPLGPGEVFGVVAAGMGPRSLVAVCEQAREKRVRWLALQCVQHEALVRTWLQRSAWRVLAASSPVVRGRSYPTWVVEVPS